jgi:hypothetical protein
MDAQDFRGIQEAYMNVYENLIYDEDIIFYLIDEGYAETPETANAIMVNMSEDWKNAIKKTVKGAGEVAGAAIGGVIGKKTSSKNPLARLANATSRTATKTISNSKAAKSAKRFVKYTALGAVGGALF